MWFRLVQVRFRLVQVGLGLFRFVSVNLGWFMLFRSVQVDLGCFRFDLGWFRSIQVYLSQFRWFQSVQVGLGWFRLGLGWFRPVSLPLGWFRLVQVGFISLLSALSFIQIRGQDGDEVDHVPRGEEKTKNEVRDEAYGLPMNLINILENPNNWIKRNLHGKHEKNGRYYYAKMHQNPMEYRNTYQYLVFRYASVNRLNSVIEKLYQWELEFHNNDEQEVLKCWRLHLGSCDVFKMVIAAHHYDAKSTYQLFLKKWYLPLKTRWPIENIY